MTNQSVDKLELQFSLTFIKLLLPGNQYLLLGETNDCQSELETPFHYLLKNLIFGKCFTLARCWLNSLNIAKVYFSEHCSLRFLLIKTTKFLTQRVIERMRSTSTSPLPPPPLHTHTSHLFNHPIQDYALRNKEIVPGANLNGIGGISRCF